MLCSRAGVECISLAISRPHTQVGTTPGRAHVELSTTTRINRQELRRRTHHAAEHAFHTTSQSCSPSERAEDEGTLTGAATESSATSALVKEVFTYHHGSPPIRIPILVSRCSPRPYKEARGSRSKQGPSELRDRLLAALPDGDISQLLIDTFFDRVHWFILAFHQEEFRSRWRDLHQPTDRSPKDEAGFLSVVLAVLCIASDYVGEYRQSLHRIDWQALQNSVQATLRECFLPIVSLGSLEAAQACVLLGSFYLYRGDQELAWPICGCALRIAQALNLHKACDEELLHSPTRTESVPYLLEARRRCWWAIYEIETFCCMLYGHIPTIADVDCDVKHLDVTTRQLTSYSTASSRAPENLLTYKLMMSKLSVLIKAILVDLYGAASQRRKHGSWRRSQGHNNVADLVEKYDKALDVWNAELPSYLRTTHPAKQSYDNVEVFEQSIGGRDSVFEEHTRQLQALALELAYENSRILLHRPMLLHRFRSSRATGSQDLGMENGLATESPPLSTSLEICHRAAMRTSHIGSLPAFKFAIRTYAAAFMSAHLFTAGVALCTSAMSDPFAQRSSEAKLGLQTLIALQKVVSAPALSHDQGPEILTKLVHLMLERESSCILGDQSTQSISELQNNERGMQPATAVDPALPQHANSVAQSTGSTKDVEESMDSELPTDPMYMFDFENYIDYEQAWMWNWDVIDTAFSEQ